MRLEAKRKAVLSEWQRECARAVHEAKVRASERVAELVADGVPRKRARDSVASDRSFAAVMPPKPNLEDVELDEDTDADSDASAPMCAPPRFAVTVRCAPSRPATGTSPPRTSCCPCSPKSKRPTCSSFSTPRSAPRLERAAPARLLTNARPQETEQALEELRAEREAVRKRTQEQEQNLQATLSELDRPIAAEISKLDRLRTMKRIRCGPAAPSHAPRAAIHTRAATATTRTMRLS